MNAPILQELHCESRASQAFHASPETYADSFARLTPYLEQNIQVLADFPEPAVAMV